jgi:hypothetical protein
VESHLDGDLVDLVEQVDARDVGPVALDDVDQVVGRGVVSQRDVGVVNLILGQNRLDLKKIGRFRVTSEQIFPYFLKFWAILKTYTNFDRRGG